MNHTTALDLFKFYSGELKEVQTLYVTLLLTTSIALLGTIVWFLTSDKPYQIVARIKYARNAFWSCLVFAAILEGRIILVLMNTANKIQTAISSVVPKMDAHLSISAYTYNKISWEMAIWFYSFHFIMYSLLGYLIWKSKKTMSLASSDVSRKRGKVRTDVQAAA